jgi:DNA-binding NarL/FixJ family response regulator
MGLAYSIRLIWSRSHVEDMGIITERERAILESLKEGMKVMDIAKEFGVATTSISRSISNIRHKCLELEDDIEFLLEIGFLRIRDGGLEFISRDPKDLRPRP